jgi:hypothetical protein
VDRKRIGREIPFITLRASRSTMRSDGSYRIGYLHLPALCAVYLTGLHCCAPCPTQVHHLSRIAHLRAPLVYCASRIVARASSCVMVWATENHRGAIDRKRDGEGECRSSRCVHHEARCVRTALIALAACTAGVGGRPRAGSREPGRLDKRPALVRDCQGKGRGLRIVVSTVLASSGLVACGTAPV